MRWRGEFEGVLLLPLPVCLQSRFQQCQHVLAPTGALLCCCLTEYTGCCVAVGCKGQLGYLSETEKQTGSQTARRYSAGCSIPQSGVLWQLSRRVLLLCSWTPGHQLGLRGRRLFHLSDGTNVGTTASIPNSVLCRAICEDVGLGALRIVILYHLQCECFLQLWSLCSLCCKAWNFSSDFWKSLPRCPDTRCEFLTFFWICLQKISVFFLQVLKLVLQALSFQAVFGSILKFLVEWMTGQSLQLFTLDGSFVLTSALQRLKVCSLFHLLDWLCFS